MRSPRSESLFHFTRSYEALFSILNSELQLRYCVEDYSWVAPQLRGIIPMVCFCDIPLGRAQQHMQHYGSYGIGFTKEWVLNQGGNPVFYICKNSRLKLHYGKFLRGLGENETLRNLSGVEWFQNWLKSHTYSSLFYKPYALTGTDGSIRHFHQECEWRVIPELQRVNPFCVDTMLEKILAELDDRVYEEDHLSFNPDDIKYLIVQNESDAKRLIRDINALQRFQENEKLALIQRITRSDDLRSDF